jgi:hypothetical protein
MCKKSTFALLAERTKHFPASGRKNVRSDLPENRIRTKHPGGNREHEEQ